MDMLLEGRQPRSRSVHGWCFAWLCGIATAACGSVDKGPAGTGGAGVAGGTAAGANGQGVGGTGGSAGSANGDSGAAGTAPGGTSGVDGGGGGSSGAIGSSGAPAAGAGGGAGSAGGNSGTPFVYVSGGSSTLRIYKFSPETGMLQAAGMSTAGGTNPNFMAFHPNKRFLYAVNESGNSSKVLAFAIDPTTGALTKLAQNSEGAASPGMGPAHISVHASGQWLYVAHFNSGHVTAHAIDSNGGVGAAFFSNKPVDRETHQVKQDPTGKFLFVPSRSPNVIVQYRLDQTTGMLTANTPATVAPPVAGTGPRHMDFHPNGKWAYVLGELNGHVVSYQYDGQTGLLSSPEDLPTRDGENAAAHILVHPNGKFAFASLRKSNEIVTLTIDATSGRLSVKGYQGTMISGPRDFTIDPSGRYLLVANQGTNTVGVFSIAETDGTLTYRSSIATEGVTQPSFVGALTLP